MERSTLGTAGFKRDRATVVSTTPSAAAEIVKIRRLRFFVRRSGRATSMEERPDVEALGRAIVLPAPVFLKSLIA
jgi:hypothetical protein